MSDPFANSILEGAAERYRRFARHFRLQDAAGERVNQVLDEESDKIKIRDGEQRLPSLMMGPLLGKAMKTFAAVQRLCVLGYGEDAAILLRSNVNLLVNLAYIVSNEAPDARAHEFVADSWERYAKSMKQAFDHEVKVEDAPLPVAEIPGLAKAWNKMTIADRAKCLPEHHYRIGDKFYSGIEHSDALALSGYIADWNEVGPKIESGPSDSHIDGIMMHNAEVMASVLDYSCRYWKIKRPESSRH
jgi:hypothetical protein